MAKASLLSDLMSAPVLSFTAGRPASDAWALMRAEGVRHAVVMRGKTLIGVLSDRDLGGERGGQARQGRTVGDLMKGPPVVAPPTMALDAAAELLAESKIGCLPVVTRGRVVGIVTRGDLLGERSGKPRHPHARPRAGAADAPRSPRATSPNVDKR